jgi:hypothetical protein
MYGRLPAAFSLAALYASLDAQRQARGLNWAQAVRDINQPYESTTSRPIARSTIVSLRTKRVAEGDGVLAMLRWLDRSPESFVAGRDPAAPDVKLPLIQPDKMILRLDTRKMHAALNAERIRRGLTWEQVAAEVGRYTAASLTYLSKGGRTGFPDVMSITSWLDRPLAHFVRIAPR